ncbi:MAG: T9SS type A sorting domain-containing protein [Bacteroidia bacterium]|jgi:hypothetical protein|nr:T9SS type A sorting domain-containing protein [Bacteroidia bacterium]
MIPSLKYRNALILLILLISALTIKGQSLANYSVTRNTGIIFSPINAIALPCNSWRYSGGFQQDDNRSNPIPIGFDFWYNGIRYTELSVSTNGYIDFSATTADGGPTTGPYGYFNGQFSLSGGTTNALAVFYDDQTTQGGSDPLGLSIRYMVTGTAPNRVLTVEWFNMAIYLNTSPNLNYQLKLYESTGQIQYVYGTMTQGTANFSYTVGMNAATLSFIPTAAQLRTQQTANTATFTNTPQNNLSAMPANNSRINFLPPVPANPAGTLAFSAITSSQMTLTWPNWATNEVGYVIYSSTDGIDYDFETQTAANATTATITSLYAATTYYWRVYAVTEGALSTPLTGTQATTGGTTFISVQSGNWNTGSTWNIGTVPGPADNVIIANTHTVTINTNAACNNLQVGQGASGVLRFGNNNTSRTLDVGGTINIRNNGTFTVNTASLTTHQLFVNGNISNGGILNLAPTGTSLCDVTFDNPYASQIVNGVGTTNIFNRITVSKLDNTNRTVDIATSTFNAANGFLTLVQGTLRLSVTGPFSAVPFNTTADIPRNARLWINSGFANVSTTGGNINLYGELRVTAGVMNVGNNANQNIVSYGGLVTVSGGTLNIAGRLDRINSTSLVRLNISGGQINVPTVGSTSTTSWPIMMDVVGSQFTQTGGTIVIRREGGTGTSDLGFNGAGVVISNVTGGVLQIGDATTPATQTMNIRTVAPVGNLLVNSPNATARIINDPLRVIRDITLASGTFNANNQNVELGGNWVNTGGTYQPGTNTTTFSGTAAQTISRTLGDENFNNITFTNAGVKTMLSNFGCNNLNIFTVSTLDAGTPGYRIAIRGNWSNAGSYNGQTAGTVLCNGTVTQTIGGAAITNFRNLTIQNTAGVNLAAAENLLGTLTLNSGMFTTTGFAFTLVSNTQGTARIAAITGGDITGNIIMQRHIYQGPTNWRQMSTAVSGQTFESWDDDLITAGFPGSDYPNLNGFYSIAPYDETQAGPKEIGYAPPANSNDPILTNRGYYVYVGPLAVTVDVDGPPNKFNRTIPLTYTPSAGYLQDGWNMVPNPYPSSINWDNAGWTRTGIEAAIYVWNPTLNQYATYVSGIGTNGGTANIPSTQAFWVHAIAPSPTLGMTESVKSATDAAFMRMNSATAPNGLMRLSVTDGNVRNDELIIRFYAGATDGFDADYDAWKLPSSDTLMPVFSSLINDSMDASVNSMAPLGSDVSIPVRLKVGVTGQYTISRDTLWTMPNSACIILEDLLTGTLTNLQTTNSYTFTIADTTEHPRFVLHTGVALDKSSLAATCGTAANGKAIAKGTGNGPWNYTWLDAQNNVIATHTGITGADTLHNIAAGIYTVQVSGNSGLCGYREDTIHVNGPLPVMPLSQITPATCSNTADGSIRITQIAGGNGPYQLLWPDGSQLDSLTTIAAGSYTLQITDANGCVTSQQINVPALYNVQPAFSLNTDTLEITYALVTSNFTTGATSYLWNFGDGGQSTQSNPVYYYYQTGDYTVTLTAAAGTCTDSVSMMLHVYDPTGITETTAGTIQFMNAPGAILVNFNTPLNDEARILVYDRSGRIVAEQQAPASGIAAINMSTQAEGIYIVQITIGNEVVKTAKVMLLRQQ